MNRWRFGAAIACATIIALAVAACGDDDDDGGGSETEAASTSTAPAPEGQPIRLGFICSCTGAQAAVLGGTDTAAEAWEQNINENGGINGSPVQLSIKDDGGDPAAALQAAKELVEEDDVVAIVGMFSLADAAIGPYLTQQGIPVIGGPNLATFLSNPDWFTAGSNLLSLTFGTMQIAAAEEASSVGVMYCSESPVCAELVPLAQAIGGILDIEVEPIEISGTAPNYTAPCLQLKDNGVEALFIANNGPVIQRVLASCSQQGYDPIAVGQSTVVGSAYLGDAAVDGTINSGPVANTYDDSLPPVAEFQDAVNAVEDGFTDGDQFTYVALIPWVSGKLFEAAAEAGKLDANSTSEEIQNAMYQLGPDETLDGLTIPLNFVKGQPTFTECWFQQSVADGELVTDNNNEPTCMTAEQATQLQEVLAAAAG